VTTRGTDNALHRLGHDLVVRLPRHAVSVPALRKELRWLPVVAPHLPLAVPALLAAGVPGEGFPFEWAALSWVGGEPATPERLADQHAAMVALADFIRSLQGIDASQGPTPGGRGGPLAPRDGPMRAAMERLGERIDGRQVSAIWEDALGAPVWDGRGFWLHGNLDARNVVASDGRISGVVDFGSMAIGDPACDVMVAWKMVAAADRDAFRRALAVDEATWRRARGWALSQALIALAYYTPHNNPVLVDEAWRWYREVLAESAS
jgi:aminoglycoside phosphotransferase (APT) family kinase protein